MLCFDALKRVLSTATARSGAAGMCRRTAATGGIAGPGKPLTGGSRQGGRGRKQLLQVHAATGLTGWQLIDRSNQNLTRCTTFYT